MSSPLQIGYLTEILDSAQEGFPSLWVNSEKYSFTRVVLDNGLALFDTFNKLTQVIKTSVIKIKRKDLASTKEI